jgi:hypothetical protein
MPDGLATLYGRLLGLLAVIGGRVQRPAGLAPLVAPTGGD